MAQNTVYQVTAPDQRADERQAAEDLVRYGRVLDPAERVKVRRTDAVKAERDARINAERSAYLRNQLYASGEAARARLMSGLNPLRIAAETYTGDTLASGMGRVLRMGLSTNMRPGFVRIARDGSGRAVAGAREAAALQHGQAVAGREAAASRAAQFREIRRASGHIARDAARSASRESTARAVETAYEHSPYYIYGDAPSVYDPVMIPAIRDAAAAGLRAAREAGREVAREFANQAMGRTVANTAEAMGIRAAQIADRFGPGTYSRAMQGPGVDWSRTFYSGLLERTASAVSRGVAFLKDLSVPEIAAAAGRGAVKYASAPRLAHSIATKVPGVRWVVDKSLPTMSPATREATLNALTAMQDAGLAAGYAVGKARSSAEAAIAERSRELDERLGYLRAGFDYYSTNSVYGTGRDADMDAASWSHAARQLIADRDVALNYVDGRGGIILPGRQPGDGAMGYRTHGQADIERLFDDHIEAMASLPAAHAAKDANRAALFGILSGGVMSYEDARALAADEGADKGSRDRAKAALDQTDRVFDSWSPSEQAFTDMDEFAKEYFGGGRK